jgi:hypothetical protein
MQDFFSIEQNGPLPACHSQEVDASDYWSWEESFSAVSTLQKIANAQQQVIATVQGNITNWLKQLASLSP